MTITRVHGADIGAWSTGTSFGITLGDTPTAGNVLFAVIGVTDYSAVVSVSSISQTNVSWSLQAQQKDSYRAVEIWLGVVSASPGTAITVNLDGTPNNARGAVCEYSGIAATPLDKVSAGDDGYSTTGDTAATATTTQDDELWLGGIKARYVTSDHSNPTNSFTLLDGAGLAYLEKIVSATGSADCETTIDATDYWVGIMATFKASAAPAVAEILRNHEINLKNIKHFGNYKSPMTLI